MENQELNTDLEIQSETTLQINLNICVENANIFIDELEKLCEKYALNKDFFLKFNGMD